LFPRVSTVGVDEALNQVGMNDGAKRV